ncbi:MAG: thiamine ABC transporter substrate-binding protein [Candidatus Promineifilaceae bacterium]
MSLREAILRDGRVANLPYETLFSEELIMRKFVLYFALALWLVGCGQQQPPKLTVMTHDSFAISEATLQQFEQAHNVTVELLPAGDAGAALNQAILAKDAPLADLFFGVDNTFMGRALAAGIFIPYRSPALENVPEALQLDPTYHLTPIDYGDVCLNYDVAWFQEKALEPPANLDALIDPAYRGLLVVQNPATSSPGLAFLLATIAAYGPDGYLDYWRQLRANDVLVTAGWQDAYYGHFTAASDGDRPIVVSYASSPAAEVFYGELATAPTASVTAANACFRQVEFVGILQGSQQPELAQQFVDFMLSQPFQEDIPLNMFVYPALEGVTLPEVFVRWAQQPAATATLPPAEIDANREQWIEAWTEVVLR